MTSSISKDGPRYFESKTGPPGTQFTLTVLSIHALYPNKDLRGLGSLSGAWTRCPHLCFLYQKKQALNPCLPLYLALDWYRFRFHFYNGRKGRFS